MNLLEKEKLIEGLTIGKILALMEAVVVSSDDSHCKLQIGSKTYLLFRKPQQETLSLLSMEELREISKLRLYHLHGFTLENLETVEPLKVSVSAEKKQEEILEIALELQKIKDDHVFALHPFSGKVFLDKEGFFLPLYHEKRLANALLYSSRERLLNGNPNGIWSSIFSPRTDTTYLHARVKSIHALAQRERSFHMAIHPKAPLEVLEKVVDFAQEKLLFPLIVPITTGEDLERFSRHTLQLSRILLHKDYLHELSIFSETIELILYKEKSPFGAIEYTKHVNSLLEQLKAVYNPAIDSLEQKDKSKEALTRHRLLEITSSKKHGLTATYIKVLDSVGTKGILANFLTTFYSLTNHLNHEIIDR